MLTWNLRIPAPLPTWAEAQVFLEALARAGGQVISRPSLIPWVTVHLPEDANPLALPGVTDAEPDAPGEFLDLQAPLPRVNVAHSWGSLRVNADEAHDVTQGQGVHVAIVDTGWVSHDEFDGADVRSQTSLVEGDPDPTDRVGHGTAVLSMAACQGVNVLGSAPGAAYHVIKVSADGVVDTLLTADGIRLAEELGADIVNLSLGWPFEVRAVRDAVLSFVERGGLVVAAAGNNGSSNFDDTSLRFPAWMPEVIAVGASYKLNDRPAIPFVLAPDFGSAWGPWPDSPDCIAPGDELVVASLDNGYLNAAGTSLASPLAAGCLALSMAANPQQWEASGLARDSKYGADLPARVVTARALLAESCAPTGASRDTEGYGLVDALALVSTTVDTAPPGNDSPASGVDRSLLVGGGLLILGGLTLGYMTARS